MFRVKLHPSSVGTSNILNVSKNKYEYLQNLVENKSYIKIKLGIKLW